MPDYTYSPAPVLVEVTGEFAIGAVGVLRPSGSGTAVQVYDLNGSPLPNVTVGPKGAHQAFKADIPDGILDFGSVLLPAISHESLTAALSVQQAAEDAASSAAQAANDADAAAAAAAGKADLVEGVVPDAQLPARLSDVISQVDGDARYALQTDLAAAVASSVRITALTDKVVNNSATFSTDGDLTLAVNAGERWQIDGHMLYTLAVGGGATTDVKMSLLLPAGSTGWWQSVRVGWGQPGAAGTSTGLLTDVNTGIQMTLQEGTQGANWEANIVAGATGSITLRWAQNTAAAFDLTRLAGSNMMCERLS